MFDNYHKRTLQFPTIFNSEQAKLFEQRFSLRTTRVFTFVWSPTLDGWSFTIHNKEMISITAFDDALQLMTEIAAEMGVLDE